MCPSAFPSRALVLWETSVEVVGLCREGATQDLQEGPAICVCHGQGLAGWHRAKAGDKWY